MEGYIPHGAKDFLICEDKTNSYVSVGHLIYSIPKIIFGCAQCQNEIPVGIDYSSANFTENPIVIVSPSSTIAGTTARVQFGTVTMTNASIVVQCPSTVSTPVYWVAMSNNTPPWTI